MVSKHIRKKDFFFVSRFLKAEVHLFFIRDTSRLKSNIRTILISQDSQEIPVHWFVSLTGEDK